MFDKFKIKIYEYHISNGIKRKYSEKELINLDKNKDNDNDNSKLKSDEIKVIEETNYSKKKHHFNNRKITYKDLISLFLHILICIIVLFHSFHFILSEYVRNIN